MGWVLGCFGLGGLLLAGCDHSREADSRVRMVIDTQTRQLMDPRIISTLRVEVLVPEDGVSIIEELFDVTEPEVLVEIEVPQGTSRHIRVDAVNPFAAVIFSGATVVDLFLPVHNVELFLSPIFSVNVALETQVSADDGALLTVASQDLGLLDLIVDIPPGALDRDGVVVIGTRNHPPLLPPLPPGGVPMGLALGFESDGAMLTQPIMLTLPYDEFKLSMQGLGPEALRFYHLDMGMSAWSEVTILNIDPDMVTITVALPAFGSGVLGIYMP
ncbi:MAG: hypothetical protein ETSY2_14000 [Candidatus Entotheonella gemina]|uniref:Uncharacterized protein n=1 Tax=Candidatus Entotheonella gemina TaxID=1429439 RepID=W4M9B4_9BACT|nr:MAG: hypothetical protein ETSY2_14000 [Candidatus Entotheonella gemina]